jgi:hypothetical protein
MVKFFKLTRLLIHVVYMPAKFGIHLSELFCREFRVFVNIRTSQSRESLQYQMIVFPKISPLVLLDLILDISH